jgi:hypothetical protein
MAALMPPISSVRRFAWREDSRLARDALAVLAAKDPPLGVLAVAGANDAQRVPLEGLRGPLFGVDHRQPHGVAQFGGAHAR